LTLLAGFEAPGANLAVEDSVALGQLLSRKSDQVYDHGLSGKVAKELD
jgi:2-polyprenyl-6-methoxyphenol hydroxylase-like FAD-dependent oxidoreductase